MTILISPLPHRVSLATSSEIECRRILYLRQRHDVGARVMLCRIDVKDAFRQIPVDPFHAGEFGYVCEECAVVNLFLHFWWRSSPGYWDLLALSLDHAHKQTSFQGAMISDNGRSPVAHAGVDAGAGWETMSIVLNCERVPSAGDVAGSPDAGRETMPIPPGREHVQSSGVTTDVTDLVGRRYRYRQMAHTHKAPALPLAPLTLTGRRCPTSECERVHGNGGDAGDPFFVRFYVEDGILVDVRFFRTGAGCDVP